MTKKELAKIVIMVVIQSVATGLIRRVWRCNV